MVEYDTLQIKIEADSKQANTSIKNLSTSLKTLDERVKELDTNRLKEVRGLLQGIAKIDFSNVVKGLQSVVSAFNALKNKSSSKSTQNAVNKGTQLEGNYPVDYTYTAPKPIQKVKFDDPTFYIKGLNKLKIVTGETAKEQEKLSKSVDKVNKNAQKASTNGLKKLLNQFKNIMKYRIIRKIIQEIYKALQEGVQNVAQFDTGVQDSLSKLTSSFSYLKNSIGAMFAPLIQIVEPILSELMMLVGDLANEFAELFAGMNGQSTFSKATYDLKEYNKEAQKTQSLGIDELNVLNQDDNAGGFTTEAVDLGEKETDLANSLKEIFSSIKEVVKPIFEAFKDLADKVLPAISSLLQPISKILGVIFDLIGTLVDETFEEVNNSIASFIEAIGSIFNFVATIVSDLMPALKQVILIISSVLNIINGYLSGAFEAVAKTFDLLTPVADVLVKIVLPVVTTILAVVTTIFSVVEGIVKSLVALVTFDWGSLDDIWSGIGEKIGNAWKSAVNDMSDVYSGSYATGGFPEDGFFFANHNELVGQFSNGQTAVANNQQITQGIYEAVLQAMRESGSNRDVIINLDGHELAKVVTEKQNNFGADVVFGGNIKWGT